MLSSIKAFLACGDAVRSASISSGMTIGGRYVVSALMRRISSSTSTSIDAIIASASGPSAARMSCCVMFGSSEKSSWPYAVSSK